MLWVNFPIVDKIHSKGNKFVSVTGVTIKATGDSKLNDSLSGKVEKNL